LKLKNGKDLAACEFDMFCFQKIFGLLALGLLLLSVPSCRNASGPVPTSPDQLRKPPALADEDPLGDGSASNDIFKKLEGIWIPENESRELYENPDLLRDSDLGFKRKLPFAWYAHRAGFSFLQELYLKDSYALKRFHPYVWGRWKDETESSIEFEFFRDRDLQIFLRALMPDCQESRSLLLVSRSKTINLSLNQKSTAEASVEIVWQHGSKASLECSRTYVPLPLQEF
jgi:hypothetical protein